MAHEFGHLSGQHSRFGNWIYTIKESWIQVLLNLERTYHNTKSRKSLWQFDILLLLDVLTFIATGIGYLIFGWLFERWVIAFTAQSFVLSRINEYEADRFAASWLNGQHLAEGLLSISIKDRYLQQVFWPSIYDGIRVNDQEPPDAIALMSQKLKKKLPQNRQAHWLKAALKEESIFDDTHPCLSERLLRLGYRDEAESLLPNLVVTTSALDELLSTEEQERLLTQKSLEWKHNNQGYWDMWTQYLTEASSNLKRLEIKEGKHALSFEDKWNRCKWVHHLQGDKAAFPLIKDLLEEKSFFAPAHQLLGEILLRQQDDQGIQHLETAATCDDQLSVPAYAAIRQYIYCEIGDTKKVQKYYQDIEQHYLREAYAPTGILE